MTSKISFIVLTGIYLSAFAFGGFIYFGLDLESLIARIIIADLAATVYVFLFSTILRNSSVYDPYWSVAPLVLVPLFVETWSAASILMLVVVGYWGIRLTANWVVTFEGLSHEDWRYGYFKERFPRLWPLVNLFGIHLMPTVVVILVMIPAWLYLRSDPTLNLITFIGATVSIMATTIQLKADRTIHAFRRNRPGKTCEEGLWKHSRHPNYFGEILMWFGVFIMMVGVASEHYLAVIGPLLNLLMFIVVSIPLMERRQIRRKAGYRTYMDRTNVLLPIPLTREQYDSEEHSSVDSPNH